MIMTSCEDFRDAARRRLPRFLFDYIDGGAMGEETLRRNKDDLRDVRIRQRVLADVSDINLKTKLLGQPVSMPIVLGPVGLAGMYARRGEVQAARAARVAGVPFCLSTVSICSLEEVAVAAAPPWLQLYMIRDRGFMADLLDQARETGCGTLVFTVDMPVPGLRRRDVRSGLSGPMAASRRMIQAVGKPAWAVDVGLRGRPHSFGNIARALSGTSSLEDFMGWLGRNFDPTISWKDLDFIRSRWTGPLVIKGVLDVGDAREAAASGAAGIVVSNHGGRQLDGASSSAEALPAIADAVGGTMSVLADSGVRSGLDVLRMLALGAEGVLLGRAWVYALAAGGQSGVEELLALFRRELEVSMALAGVRSVDRIDRGLLVQKP